MTLPDVAQSKTVVPLDAARVLPVPALDVTASERGPSRDLARRT